MTDSLFTPTNEQPTTPSSYRDQLVGPGKKFADDEALAKGKAESDLYILSMQRETKELRAELEARLALEEVAERTAPRNAPITNSNPQGTPPLADERVENKAAPVPTRTELAQLIKETMQEEQTKTTMDSNRSLVLQELKKTWGDNYIPHLNAKANELGMDKDMLDSLAARSPKAFLALVANEPSRGTTQDAPPVSKSNTGFVADTSSVRNEEYYSKLRKSDPKRYFSAATQVQRHKDALEMGAKFFNLP